MHLILDNHATHKTALIRRWLAKRPRYQTHFTPTSAPWLNLVERCFADPTTTRQPRRSAFRRTEELEQTIRRYLEPCNQDPKAVLLDQISRWYPRLHRLLLPANFGLGTLAAEEARRPAFSGGRHTLTKVVGQP